MKISDFCGKRVISKNGRQGYVLAVCQSEGRVCGLVCADEEEDEFTIDIKNVIKIANVITFDDRESMLKHSKKIILGLPGFDSNGNFLGTLRDFYVTKDKIKDAVIGKRKYPAEEIIFGDAAILKPDANVVKKDVIKDGKVLFKEGTPVTDKVLSSAEDKGEYIQTRLKPI